MTTTTLVLYGDFNCPFSAVASRPAAHLANDGAPVIERDGRDKGGEAPCFAHLLDDE